ncbi:MAG: bifunctional nuclease family protein [Actinomycetota bacterium]
MVPLELLGVRMEVIGNVPVVFLREREGLRRLLPIYVGVPEASSIQLAVEGREAPRPLTHDLMVNVLGALGAVLDKVVITDVDDGTFFAELHLQTRTGAVTVSSRPSDGIALAVRAGANIYCEPDVLDEAGRVADIEEVEEQPSGPVPVSEETQRELLGEFRDFLEGINPEDFQA